MAWDVELRIRKEVIVIAEILEQWSEYAADFPGMKIRDEKGKEHEFSYIDLMLGSQKWNEIQVGSKIELTIKEKVEETRLLPEES